MKKEKSKIHLLSLFWIVPYYYLELYFYRMDGTHFSQNLKKEV
jgi:hypothetical protein